MDDPFIRVIILAICFLGLVAIHHVLGVPNIVAALAPNPILSLIMWFESLALLAIFGGIFIEHIAHMWSVTQDKEHKNKKGFGFSDLFLGIVATSFSVGIYVFLHSVKQ